jgi:2,3,4,5-tetrahydropyridine-2-carboxylate N-succinyltransferase
MADKTAALGRFEAIDHLVLVRAYDKAGALCGVFPNLGPLHDSLRVLHGCQDRDGRVGREEAEKALPVLHSLGAEAHRPVVELLERAHGGETLQLRIIASPVAGLLARLAGRGGSKADTAAFIELLNAGDVRAAEKVSGHWQPQPYVIDGILNYFKVQDNFRVEPGYWDKIPLKTANLSDEEFRKGGVRYAPGCRVRTGCYIGPGTVVMNQAFINIGAFIAGDGVMVDGGARVASCAQIGKGVKFGAGSGIEGILEPAGRLPSIIEDQAKIGAMCEVSGIIGEGAVVASGVVMASGKKIYDEETGKPLSPLEVKVGQTTYLVPVIPPYRLAVGGSLISESARFATDAIILKPGDLRDRATLKHFEKQGILYQ